MDVRSRQPTATNAWRQASPGLCPSPVALEKRVRAIQHCLPVASHRLNRKFHDQKADEPLDRYPPGWEVAVKKFLVFVSDSTKVKVSERDVWRCERMPMVRDNLIAGSIVNCVDVRSRSHLEWAQLSFSFDNRVMMVNCQS